MKRKNRDTPGRRIAQDIIAQYKPKSVAEMQAALKWKVILATNQIPARKKRRQIGVTATSTRLSRPSMGETEIEVPRDRQAFFELIILPKHKRDMSEIENKVLAMYARGMSQRDISSIIDDIYGFKLSAEQISKITDYVLNEQES